LVGRGAPIHLHGGPDGYCQRFSLHISSGNVAL
jgi:hypothetical protein